jgi:hypothetical protein
MKRASVIKFKNTDVFLLHSTSTMKEGGGITTEPYIKLQGPVSNEELFTGLMKALNGSKMGVSRPKDFDKSLKEYLKALGLKEHEDLYKQSVCVTVVNRNDMISFFPTKNEGIKGGFAIVPADKIEIAEKSSSDEIIQTLLSALEKSK